MKTSRAGFFVPVIFCLTTASLFAQGDLNPPGAPAPTMKTLDQVEARIIVNATNTAGDSSNTFIISQPGTYYLTGKITGEKGKHGISVQADDVTIDLNGFALTSGGTGSFRGIDVPAAQENLSVRNGVIRGWGDGGVRGESAINSLYEKLRLSENAGSVGLFVGNGSMIKDCVAAGNLTGFRTQDRCQVVSCVSTINSGNGFESSNYVSIIDCTSSRNSGHGFQVAGNSQILRCSATRNDLNGIHVETSCHIADSTASTNVGRGIRALLDTTIRNCTLSANADGILVTNGCTVTENTCIRNANGIRVEIDGTTNPYSNRIDGNTCTNNLVGFAIHGLFNQIIRNVANNNSTQAYDIQGPLFNQIGPIITSGGTITSENPWANFQR